MSKHITWVGIDDHKMNLSVAVCAPDGELTAIATPRSEDEAVRDLVRTYHQVVEEARRKRHHILKFLTRRGRIYRDGRNWTQRHQRWLDALQWDDPADEFSYTELVMGLRELEDRRDRLGREMERISRQEQYAVVTGVLGCFQGISTVAAMTIVAELFDIRRFGHPRQLASYLGLTPSVYQSGEREVRGRISKTGNRYVRWVLGQVAWHYRHRPRIGERLRERRQGQPRWATAIADRAHRRLYHRYSRLIYGGKPSQKAVTAVARELVSFVWEALQAVEERRTNTTKSAA